MLPRVILAATLLTGASLSTAAKIDLSSDRAQFSYAIGQQIANSLIRDKLDVDMAVVSASILDAAAGTAQLTPEQQMAAVQKFQEQQNDQQGQQALKNKELGSDYLAKNRIAEGVIETESGLQYVVVTAVKEGTSPTDTADVTVHYRGTLVDGTQFDSSFDRGTPATFNVAQVIPGWQEALQLMKPGETYRLTIPPELAYGQNAPPSIGPDQVLLFDVELISIN
ncbi:MAG: hypothetical protein DRQ60_02060 [Gammaproteobacteria bacterium]|nr:MAG: hypothetical protein DRQ54_00780 [Gammaproteobacteria bacterium]RLA15800.1 MAG: hypothetical protein DRQ52_00925 [Gammaproteobacteria bacterium]RLA17419.1 MAG: hypothetical protein DRQ60_02060 [Gammaproteobacteria bacterium]